MIERVSGNDTSAAKMAQLTRLVEEAPTGDDWLHEIKYAATACIRASTTIQVKLAGAGAFCPRSSQVRIMPVFNCQKEFGVGSG